MIFLDRFGHLFSDSSIEELYEFAVSKLNLKPEWNHYSRNFPHFDLTTKSKQKKAIELGAVFLEETKDILEKYNQIKSIYPTTGPTALPYIQGTGLNGQKILRVDFFKYYEIKRNASSKD